MRRAGWWIQLASLIALCARGQSGTPGWAIYTNARFAFSVCYPRGVLVTKGESDNGDGETFSLRQGDGKVYVSGGYAAATTRDGRVPSMGSEYVDALHQIRNDGFQPGYSVLKATFFVVSGTGGGKIRYQKTMRAGDRDITLLFDYPAAAKPTMDGIVSKMSECLTARKD